MPEVPPLSGAGSLADSVSRVFDHDGPLARAIDGYEPRRGQRQLASAVATTFETGGTLVAEAGTGTGKTFAYLVPAFLAGKRVLISTGTRPLQDQVYYKDVPTLARALGRQVRVAYMKGRTNYLCLHRFGRLREAESGLPLGDRRLLAEIGAWAESTDTGDRAEIDDLPDDSTLWSEVTATAEQCLGRDCPEYVSCFVTRMRDRAAAADLLIVNHHLLCADAAVRRGGYGEVIPESDLLVIDEAHQIEDVVTQYFGVSISTFRIDELTRDAGRASAQLASREEDGRKVAELIGDVELSGRQLFDAVRANVLARGGQGDRVVLTEEVIGLLVEHRFALDGALRRLAGAIERASDSSDVAAINRRIEALRDDLARAFAVDDRAHVRFAERRGRTLSVRAAPIDASSIIRQSVLASRHASILTSATLSVDGSFDYAVGRFGLEDASTLRLPPEFDYARQAVLYLPRDLPDPRSADFNRLAAERVAEILSITSGRAFVLFTSYAAMRDVHDRLTCVVEWPVLMQGSAPRHVLLRDFRSTPNAVLCATASFWQGVDVAGEALSAVIIDRLPFASPADPIVAARIDAIAARGGDAFRDYQVPFATLTLLQGLGRLIRTRRDGGVLAVLDPRMTRMGYGRRFLASLPPAPWVHSLGDLAARFAAIEGRTSSD